MNNEVDQEDGNYLGTYEICMAVCEVVGNAKIVDAAQRIGGLWRVYLTVRLARAQLFYTGINLRGVEITFKDKNPFFASWTGTCGNDSPFSKEHRSIIRKCGDYKLPQGYGGADVRKADQLQNW